MATPKSKDPLDALQSLVNDVLVQTGKALRASRKDAHGNLAQAPGTIQSKLPETIRLFHCALDELEHDIIRAKSVLLRDLNNVQEQKRLFAKPEPQPVEPQSKHPMTIDLDSPPAPVLKDEPMMADELPKPMAPFPNMSIDLPITNQVDITMKEQSAQPQPTLSMTLDGSNANGNAGVSAGPIAHMTDPDIKLEMSNNASGIPDATGMNFTNMEFSLAPPPNIEPQALPTTTNDSAFDLTTFAPADGDNDLLDINSMMPTNPTDQSGTQSALVALAAQGGASNSSTQEKVEDKKGEAADSKLNGLYGNEFGAADGMDFDFSVGGNSFDDLMDDRDVEMDAGGDFEFFGLDKTDET
ncbi:hypothetical protein PT974_10313 [Cladobotryum mycophilum]|uniref:Uncharacterized protein n=1 Tax=Cladobotryum mycophilum TaxID=491253 RepID=A0ABR0SA10_9HYPO